MRTRVKVCGISRREDAKAACESGVDALGFIFWRPSKRFVEPESVAAILAGLPPLVTSVAVVVDPSQQELARVLSIARPDVVQFHGDESAAFCEDCGRPYIKSVRVKNGEDVERTAQAHPHASALLLDTYKPGLPGGTGLLFDWSLIPVHCAKPYILAGGLNTANVAGALGTVAPFGVDVSGGVEVRPGIKDPVKIQAFVSEVNRATACQ